jgi:hypothetical protein
MKIKIIKDSYYIGRIVDALVSPDNTHAQFYSDDNVLIYLFKEQFEILAEDQEKLKSKKEAQNNFVSIRDLLGQDISSINFK